MKKTIIAIAALVIALGGCSTVRQNISDNSAEIQMETPSPQPTAIVTVPPAEYERLNSSGTGWGLVRKKNSPPDFQSVFQKSVFQSVIIEY